MRAEREAAVARRKDALTGTSEFPDLAEAPVAVLDVPTPLRRPAYPAMHRSSSRLPRVRLADRSKRCAMPPTACWLRPARGRKSFSPISAAIADFTARATFAKNFFEAGGIEAVTNDGFASQDEMIAAFKASGAALACLCSSDDGLRGGSRRRRQGAGSGGARHIYLAGRPGEREAELKAAGVQSFIFAGGDVLATLKAAHDTLGIAGSARVAAHEPHTGLCDRCLR